MSNDALEQPPVTEQTMVHEDNGLSFNKVITKARFDNIFTFVPCDKDTFTKAQNNILTPELIRSFQTSNVGRWKALELPQCLVVLHYPDYEPEPVRANRTNTLVLCIHTKNNYDVLCTLWCFRARNADDMIQRCRNNFFNESQRLTALVQQHELHCRILQNLHFIVDQGTEQMHHQKSINEHTQSIDHLQESQDEIHVVLNDVRNQQQHMQDALYVVQNALTQHVDDIKTPMVELRALKERADDVETKMTAQATVGEMHQNRIEQLQSSLDQMEEALRTVQDKQATLFETFDADLKARCEWSTALMAQIHNCERIATVTDKKHQVVVEWIQQRESSNNKWVCVYVVLAALMLYEYILFFPIKM